MIEKLLDVCDFQGGTQPPKNEWISEPKDGYIRMLQIRDYTQGDEKFIEYVLDNGKLHKCTEKDIMLSRYGYIGQAFTGLAGAYNVALVKVIKKKPVLTQYLLYFFRSGYFQHHLLDNVGARATIPGFNKSELKKAVISIPDEKRQEYVSGILKKTEGIIALRKQELQKLDELIKARFVELFGDFKINPMGWPVVGFEEIAVIDGNMTTDYKKYADYPHIGIDSIEKETGLLKGYRTVAEDGVISGKYVFTPAHIIYSKIRPNLNKVALPDFTGLCSADAYPILPIEGKCNRVFLAYDMRSKYFLDYILQFCNRTNLPKVNRKEVASFKTPLPPLELQNTFAAFVAQVDKSKVAVQKALDETQQLFDSLMQQFFG